MLTKHIDTLINKRHIPLLAIITVATILITPALIKGPGGDDLFFHSLWSTNFSTQLINGDLFPRWLMNLNAGCGEPTFYFYPPLVYYLNSLFHLLNLPAIYTTSGWIEMVLTGQIILILAGYFCFIWLHSIISNKTACLIAAITYITMPYINITFNAYLTFSEFSIFMWLPLLLYFTHKITLNEKYAVSGLSITYTLLFISTIPGTLVASGLPVLYFVYLIWPQKTKNIFLPCTKFIASVLLAIGLASFYTIPMILLQDYIRININDHMWSGSYGYRNNFLFFPNLGARAAPEITYEIYLCVILSMTTLMAYILSFKHIPKNSPYATQVKFWFFVICTTIFFTSYLSTPIWEILPILKIMQFPYRISSIATIAIIPIIAIYLTNKPEETPWALTCIIFLFAFNTSLTINENLNYIEKSVKPGTALHTLHNNLKNKFHNNITPGDEYLPKWVNIKYMQPSNLNKTAAICSQKITSSDQQTNTTIKHWKPGDIALSVNTLQNTTITIPQFYFPTWQASDNSGTILDITPQKETGLININIPPGAHHIKIKIIKSTPERIGISISIITALLLIILGLIQRKRNYSCNSN